MWHDNEPEAERWSVVLVLGTTELIAWGSVYYLFALLLQPLQVDLAAGKSAVVGAFSLALLISGVVAPVVGRLIDRYGGRVVMAAGSALAGLGLCALAYVTSLVALYCVWALLGFAMAATLYEPAFAVLVQLFRQNFRRAITALTLLGGFASTVFWPLAATLMERYGWRDTALALGALNLIICLPLHVIGLPRRRASPTSKAQHAPSQSIGEALGDRTFYLLCGAFTANILVFSATSLHLIAMLTDKGVTSVQAAFIGAMVGPMQVAGRLLEMLFGRLISPSKVGVIAMALLPVSLGILFIASDSLLLFAAFALFFGAGNGVMTIVRGTIPVELYGRAHYGVINGAMASPVLVSRAAGPLIASVLFSFTGGYNGVVVALAAIGVSSVLLFLWARRDRSRIRYAA